MAKDLLVNLEMDKILMQMEKRKKIMSRKMIRKGKCIEQMKMK